MSANINKLKGIRVSVPQDLDEVFSIENFKFGEVKGHIKCLYETL